MDIKPDFEIKDEPLDGIKNGQIYVMSGLQEISDGSCDPDIDFKSEIKKEEESGLHDLQNLAEEDQEEENDVLEGKSSSGSGHQELRRGSKVPVNVASSNAKQKLSSDSSSRKFQSWWTEKYGMIYQENKAICIICSGAVVCRTSSVKRHFETHHAPLLEKVPGDLASPDKKQRLSPDKKQKLSSDSSSRKFQRWWTEEYGMTYKENKAICVLCSGAVVCRTSSVKRHFETHHASLLEKGKEERKEIIAQAIKNRNTESTSVKKPVSSESNTTAASFAVCNVIAKHGKPFSDGEFLKEAWLQCAPYLFDDFENKGRIIQRIRDMPLARNTVKDRILKMAENIRQQENTDMISSGLISLCLDKSTDNSGSIRLAIFVRYCVGNDFKEELIKLKSLGTATKGEDIFEAVINALSERNIDPFNVVSVTTDGAPSMTSKEGSFVQLFTKHVGHSLLEFHCIIDQEVLCSNVGFKTLEKIMSTVTKVVNFISANALNKRKFDVLLKEINSAYNGLPLYNNIRWLNRGRVIQRFVECLGEVRLFLREENKIEQYQELMNVEWTSKLMFSADLCLHLRELSVKLQAVNKTIIGMLDLIQAFETKLQIFYQDVASKSFRYFPNLKKFFTDVNFNEKPDETKLTTEFSGVISSIISEFSSRFAQSRQFAETAKFIVYPDTTCADNLNLEEFDWLQLNEFEMELTDFQSNYLWKQKFVDLRKDLEIIERERLSDIFNKRAEAEILKTWNDVPQSFHCMKKVAMAVLTLFSSTYACESLFSEMNFIKNSFRDRLTEESSSACVLLKVSKYEPDIKSLSSNIQQQKSH